MNICWSVKIVRISSENSVAAARRCTYATNLSCASIVVLFLVGAN